MIISRPTGGLLNQRENKSLGPNPYLERAKGLLSEMMQQQQQKNKALTDQTLKGDSSTSTMAQWGKLGKMLGPINGPTEDQYNAPAVDPTLEESPIISQPLPELPSMEDDVPEPVQMSSRIGLDDVGRMTPVQPTAAPFPVQPAGLLNNQSDPFYKQPAFYDNIKNSLAQYESGKSGYDAQSPNSSALGKYQFIDATRQSIVPGVSRQDFQSNPELQETAMNKLIDSNISTFRNMGVDPDKVAPADLAGMVWAAHLRGPQAAINSYRNPNYQGVPDANGTLPRTYYDRGKRLYG